MGANVRRKKESSPAVRTLSETCECLAPALLKPGSSFAGDVCSFSMCAFDGESSLSF